MGAAVAALGVLGWRWRRDFAPASLTALAVVGLAAVRTSAGFALPRVSEGLTRSHRESVVALALGLVGAAALLLFRGSRAPHSPCRDAATARATQADEGDGREPPLTAG